MKVKIKIYGNVQGVFFRDFVKTKSSELNLYCEVENMPDGTVKIILKGEDKNIQRMIEHCKSGPPLADRVKSFNHDTETILNASRKMTP